MSEYFIEVYQPKEFPVLTIMVSIGKDSTHWIGPTIEAIAGELSSIEINAVSLPRWPKLNTAKYFPELWELAIAAGECLAGLIQTVDDLRRPVEASIEGDTVVVRFKG